MARKHTQSPIVTGTSVIALKYKDGVLMAADTLGSYGSLARFTDNRRITSFHESTLVGASGDFSDFQFLKDKLDSMEIEDFNYNDDCRLIAPEIFHYLQRLLYHRRNKFDPLWNTLVVAGFSKKSTPDSEISPFLGQVDMIGMAFEDDYLATGFGHHLGMPLLRKLWRPNMTEDEAKTLLIDCMRICFYRDCRTINRIQIARVTKDGTSITEPFKMDTKWEFNSFINPKAGFGGSW